MDAANTSNPSDKKKFIWLVILLIIAIVVAVVWWWNYRKYVSTIDANLDGSRVNVSVRAMAPLSAVFKQEGDSVKRGELLAVLDSTMTEDYRIVSPVDGLIAKQWVVPGDLLRFDYRIIERYAQKNYVNMRNCRGKMQFLFLFD